MKIHLRLGQVKSGKDKDRWISECGHWTTEAGSSDDRSAVTCGLCKRTRRYRGLTSW